MFVAVAGAASSNALIAIAGCLIMSAAALLSACIKNQHQMLLLYDATSTVFWQSYIQKFLLGDAFILHLMYSVQIIYLFVISIELINYLQFFFNTWIISYNSNSFKKIIIVIYIFSLIIM